MDELKNLLNFAMKKAIERGLNNLSNERSVAEYRNIHHLMKRSIEVQNPNKSEMYTFMLNDGWKVVSYNKDYITIVKE